MTNDACGMRNEIRMTNARTLAAFLVIHHSLPLDHPSARLLPTLANPGVFPPTAMPDIPFICYGGNFVVQQPFVVRRAQTFAFALDGNRDRLQALCDKTLNLSPTTRYTVVSSTVLAAFMRMERLCSGVPASAACGMFTERELNVSILLAAEEKVGPVWLPARLVWHMPYLWLDSSNAMIAGRDIYGFPKQFGSIAMPSREGEPAEFCATGEVLPRFAPQTHASIEPIATLRRTDAATVEFAEPFAEIAGAAGAFVQEVMRVTDPLLFLGAGLADLAAENLLNLVFLRQLPSIVDGSRACFQSIVEASSLPRELRDGGFLRGDYVMEIPHHDSAPWAYELGIAALPEKVTVQPHAAFHLDLDFDLSPGREIWTAT